MFWVGFFKQASKQPSIISDWMGEEDSKMKELAEAKKKPEKVDIRAAGDWVAPEAWHRYWP